MAIHISKGTRGELNVHCDICDTWETHDPASVSVVVNTPILGAPNPVTPTGGQSGGKPKPVAPSGGQSGDRPKRTIDPGGVNTFTMVIQTSGGQCRVPIEWPEATVVATENDLQVFDFSKEIMAAIAAEGVCPTLTWNGSNMPLARIANEVSILVDAPVTVELQTSAILGKLKG